MLDWIKEVTGAEHAQRGEEIQSLWSGYGSLFRVHLVGAERDCVIIKHVQPPTERHHPRGWHTDRGHQRKLRSYAVEARWYERFAVQCGARCRVPGTLAVHRGAGEWTFMLEDLDAAGFAGRRSTLSESELRNCLRWLAEFHAKFLGVEPTGLWSVGTYWHLSTRPDEHAAMTSNRLKDRAGAIDAALNDARFPTLVHGDAKVANFCFADDDVAAVDFQYVGGGCGMKDVAYLFSSCLSSAQCEDESEDLLNLYFERLRCAVGGEVDTDALEDEWRSLYPFAWADFQRFLEGWSPGHWKLGPYAERMTNLALSQL